MKANRWLILVLILLSSLSAFSQRKDTSAANAAPIMGAWDVTFNLSSNATQKLVFIAMTDGTGTFRIIGPRATTNVPAAVPAVWARPFPSFMSFSGEVRFPSTASFGETGTLLFKGTQPTATGAIVGRVMFVLDANVVATPGAFITRTGTFTAVPLPVAARSRRR